MNRQIHEDIEHMAALKSIDLFSGLDTETLYKILKIAKFRRLSKDETIIRKGETFDCFYVLLEGGVKACPDENEDCTGTAGPGYGFGELGIIDGRESTTNIRTSEESLLLEFDGKQFVALMMKNGSIAFSMARMLSSRLRDILEAY